MPQQSKVGNASWPGLPHVVDGVLCLFGALSLGFLIGLTEEFYQHGAAGDDRRKQLAPVLAFVAFAQACELADRIWRVCCRAVTKTDLGDRKKIKKQHKLSMTVPCGCREIDGGRCFADNEKSPELLHRGDENQIDRHDIRGAPARGRYRCELPLQSVKRGRGEYRIAKVRQVSSVAVIEDFDLSPRASESRTTMRSADITYDGDCGSDSDNEHRLAAAKGPDWVVVDECDENGFFLWDEA